MKERIYSEQKHILHCGGQEKTYRTICQEIPLSEGENGAATMFSVSYILDNEKDRPVLFVFNGGPGSSSLWMHLGLFGTQILSYEDELRLPVLPPYRLEENKDQPLEFCDLVFCDPPGTGYGQYMDNRFFSYEKDAEAFCQFIEWWLNHYARWNSPKYLAGESYGSFRACKVADMIGSCTDKLNSIALNGILILGNAVGCGEGICDNRTEREPLILPSLAATSWYFRKNDFTSVKEAFETAWAFSENEYRKVLSEGNRLTCGEKKKIAVQLEHLTGIDGQTCYENGLKINAQRYREQLLKKEGYTLGLYDARYTMRSADIGEPDDVGDDPAMAAYTPAFTGVFHSELKPFLRLQTDRPYRAINFAVNGEWNFAFSGRTAAQSLAAVMRRNPEFRVFFGSGFYDLITTAGETRYAVNHIDVDCSRIVIREYESGHMPYLSKSAKKELIYDIKNFMSEK